MSMDLKLSIDIGSEWLMSDECVGDHVEAIIKEQLRKRVRHLLKSDKDLDAVIDNAARKAVTRMTT